MKKLLFLLLLPFALLAQNPTSFPYGVKITGGQPTVLSNPTFVTTTATNGVQGKIPYDNLLNGRTAQGDTGVLDFGGLTTNTTTTINIGSVVGYVVDNETDPETPVVTKVNYAGASGVTVTTVGSGQASYVMLSSAGVISFQNTLPTSAERKAKIWLGKVSHPAGSITLVTNEPDYITSPMSFSRDLFQVLGPYVNDGVFAYANGANLNINITGGNIHGNGINFVNSKTSPNELAMGPGTTQAFLIRTQTGAGGGATTAITPGSYDVGGTITAIPGSSNQATIQYIWAVPGQGYIVQLGQTLYSSFSAAVQALGRESSFVIYPNLPGNAIPITALVVTKGCTSLADTGVTAQFFRANRTGEFFGSTAGVSTANFQTTYLNSLIPQITTTTALGAVTVRRGSAADTDGILVGQNGAGTNTFSVTGAGNLFVNNRIGIGNSAPLAPLTVGGNVPGSGEATYKGEIQLNVGPPASTNALSGIEFKLDAGGNGYGKRITGAFDGTSNYDLHFQNRTNSASWTSQVVIKGNGSLLLGTTTDNGIDKWQTVGSSTQTGQFKSTLATGTAPFSVASTTLNTNLNADLLDGIDSATITTPLITIITAVSITTATAGGSGIGQNGKHVVIDNGANAINLTCNGSVTASYGKVGSGAITFVQGSGRTLVQLSGTAILNGAVGSTATLWSNGTTDYLAITNY